MGKLPIFELPKYIDENAVKAKHVLAGSATPSLSIEDLIAISSDPNATEKALNFRSLKLGGDLRQGTPAVRNAIAGLYDKEKGVLPEHIITAIGTTGANLTVFQALLGVGDHVICVYPTYGQLPGLPKGFPCEVSRWELDASNGWRLDVGELRKLIRPDTKMLVLNNPNNPTGSHIDVVMQSQILEIAREQNLIVVVDEIFRPLFHAVQGEKMVPSFVEHEYGKVVVTGSMSKAWGLSGVRIGWIVCRDESLFELLVNARQYTFQSASVIDEVIATEVLSDRCRPAILKRHLEYAQKNLQLLEAFVNEHSDTLSWNKPTAASTAFIRLSSNGKPMDDVEFCRAVLQEEGLLFSPGSLCFGDEGQTALRGYVRVHFTLKPEAMVKALEAWDRFLAKMRQSLK
ncbi:pyridoxal phosphate-dependent transferase [Exophiala viscosa]|uniref:Pyridoxal phosphate-dependent transferase n=1 Tax=Exophiala viscosa TaxID=2486360 RepID=A0AAN6DRV8_9EURO|nr:pyridoxal phosphate-dependent transferase [Exophiala viscosa]